MKPVDFEHDSIGKCILKTSIPMVIAQLFNLLYNIVDRIFLGRLPGEGTASLAGVGLCFPIILIILAFSNLFGMGGAPLFSIALGAGDPEKAKRIQNTSFSLLTAASLVIMVLFLALAEPMLSLFGTSEAMMPYALPYLRIYLFGTFFSMIATGLNPFINAQGFTSAGMASVILGALLNLGLDPLFLFVFDLGIRGAALATVISQIVSAVFVLTFLRSKKVTYKIRLLKKEELRHCGPDVRAITGLGLAAFIMQFTNGLVQIVSNAMLQKFGGDTYVTVMTILSSVRQLVEIPVLSITEGASPVLSYNYGALKGSRVKQAIRIMSTAGFSYALTIWLLIRFFPGFFLSIFTNDPAVLADAVPAMNIYMFAFFFQSMQNAGQSTFKALGKKKQAIFFSLLRKAILVIPLALILPYIGGLGTKGVFMAEPISNFLAGTSCFTVMLLTVLPELNKMDRKQPQTVSDETNKKEN